MFVWVFCFVSEFVLACDFNLVLTWCLSLLVIGLFQLLCLGILGGFAVWF